VALRTIGVASLVVVLTAGAGVGAYAGVRDWRQSAAAPSSTAPAPNRALAGATSPPSSALAESAPLPTVPGVATALRGPLGDVRLGRHVLAEVRDGESGALLFNQAGTTAAAPASTAKLATALAVLAVRPATDRITTRVVAGAQPGTVVLVGGGDPMLSAASSASSSPASSALPGAARISDLAGQLRGVNVARVEVDGSLFSGPSVSPYWAPEDVPSDYAAPITAIMIDGGRDAPNRTIRSTAPDLAAGRALAAALHVPAANVARAKAPPGARVLASVESASIGTLVTQMLQTSDNVIAECLARQVALVEHQPVSFAGAAAAVRAVLAGLGVQVGAGLVDGSGLAARDRLTPDALTRLLLLATKRTAVLDMLPVAAWSGTLSSRYTSGTARAGAGIVRAKTGTLTSVSTLAGLVQDQEGRLLAFALMADRVGPSDADTAAAEAALDRVAATLARCGC
jgi:D-alanyl-D-alanine carboxypeptidase/D-alanyl-D-alanine-endopeptidase (penicillin-binding protein 4)